MTIVWRNDQLQGLGNRVVNEYRDAGRSVEVSSGQLNEEIEEKIIERAIQEHIVAGPFNEMQRQAIKEFVQDII